jgi:hypothetical protein
MYDFGFRLKNRLIFKIVSIDKMRARGGEIIYPHTAHLQKQERLDHRLLK